MIFLEWENKKKEEGKEEYRVRIFSKNEMYNIDQETMEKIGLNNGMLMENAGQAVAREIESRIKKNDKIIVIAGKGNNGGDGVVIARILKERGFSIELWMSHKGGSVAEDAQRALKIYENCGHSYKIYEENEEAFQISLKKSTVIVDALLGIGTKGKVRGPYRNIIEEMNEINKIIYAVDIPSGLNADKGEVDVAIKAHTTFVIQGAKQGAFLFPSANFYGEIKTVDIGIPSSVIEQNSYVKRRWSKNEVLSSLPHRDISSHKGTYGRALMIAGSENMPGAAVLSSKAASRSGVGLLTIGIIENIKSIIGSHLPEAMYNLHQSHQGMLSEVKDYSSLQLDAIGIGPGIGRNKETEKIVEEILKQQVTLVLDADALFHVKPHLQKVKERRFPTILTPHPGEMASLLDLSIKEVESDRFEKSREFAQTYGIYLVLKGPFTIVTTPSGEQFVNSSGNPALAKGGSGDVLTGMILGSVLQYENVQKALSNAVFIHGAIADQLVASTHSPLDVLATDIIEGISPLLHELYREKEYSTGY